MKFDFLIKFARLKKWTTKLGHKCMCQIKCGDHVKQQKCEGYDFLYKGVSTSRSFYFNIIFI